MTRSDGRALPHRALLWTLFLTALVPPSRAAERDEAGARALFGEGRKLAAAGRYAEACLKFEESLRRDPGVGTSFNLADCQEHLGLTASAWSRFLEVAAATRLAGQPERERVARARAATLEPRLSRLVVEVGFPVQGLVVARDGVPVGAPAWGTAIPVDPGPHLVEARAPGRKTWSESVSVPDAPSTIVVSVPALQALAQAVSSPATPPLVEAPPRRANPSPSEPTHRWSIPVAALGVLAMAGLTTGAAFALELDADDSDARALCPNSSCQTAEEKTRHDTLVDEAHRDRTLALTGAGIGTAALLAAAYLWWHPVSWPSRSAPAGQVSVHPVTGPFRASLEVAW